MERYSLPTDQYCYDVSSPLIISSFTQLKLKSSQTFSRNWQVNSNVHGNAGEIARVPSTKVKTWWETWEKIPLKFCASCASLLHPSPSPVNEWSAGKGENKVF
jgi:hypothetical protein